MIRIPDSLAGGRVDKVVAELAGLSRARARAVIDAGGVTLDGVAVSPSTRVTGGEVMVIPEIAPVAAMAPEEVAFSVVWEDEAVIVVDKPPGLVVHPGAGRQRGTLAAGLVFRYPELAGVGPEGRAGLVHRLDRDTSGVLIVARTEAAHSNLVEAIRRRKVSRRYLCLVVGVMEMATGTIEAPIGADPSDPRKRKVVVGGRPSRTHYRVLERFDDATLLEVTLETGRTHQIRVHLQAIDHPVIGDPWYGRPWKIECPRVFLHAWRIGFDHPITGEPIEVTAGLPSDLQAVLDRLRPVPGPA